MLLCDLRYDVLCVIMLGNFGSVTSVLIFCGIQHVFLYFRFTDGLGRISEPQEKLYSVLT